MALCSQQCEAWLRLSLVHGIGPLLGRKLVGATGDIESLWLADSEGFRSIEGVGPVLLSALKDSCSNQIKPILQLCEENHISLLCPDDKQWPDSLSNIDDAPLVLFVKGDVKALTAQKMLAVVGARRASREGSVLARRWCKYLSDQGVSIVSGMAFGIDAAAHGGALEGASPTVAVLGCGIASTTEEQRGQVEAICKQGCVISEFLPNQPARPEQFPRRNRIIAAISSATLVVEADLRSGSLITAKLAAGYGREVMAVPGSVMAAGHEGCHQLIRDGAPLISDPRLLMQELGWSGRDFMTKRVQSRYQPANENEAKIVEKLERESMHLDDLTETCGLTLPELSPILLALELQGVIKRLPGSRYQMSTE